ncbi:YqcC family protein [Pleionea sediminis]|uniref:YqcC family protein n=1 Tax=Pleionea sediminis TaxID=2569479 RepID=UPI0011861976|nr:YqcC family protein [Pleionea sediminis]
MTDPYQLLDNVIAELIHELKQLGYWAEQTPDEQALNSSLPFCIDTLEFEQWLQFVLIPKLILLSEKKHRLPAKANIHPVAEEVLKQRDENTSFLLTLIQKIDHLSGRLI